MLTQNYDEWTVERWRIEPQWRVLEFAERATGESPAEPAPPLWKDLTCASVIALLLWLAALAILR